MKVKYKGHTFKVNTDVFQTYRFQKAMMLVEQKPALLGQQIEALFYGKDEEYAELLGGKAEDMMGLLSKVGEKLAEKQELKN